MKCLDLNIKESHLFTNPGIIDKNDANSLTYLKVYGANIYSS